jgi:hypothetical protein
VRSQGPFHGYALLSTILATLLLASHLAAIKAFPYTFIVVEIWACRIGGLPASAYVLENPLLFPLEKQR